MTTQEITVRVSKTIQEQQYEPLTAEVIIHETCPKKKYGDRIDELINQASDKVYGYLGVESNDLPESEELQGEEGVPLEGDEEGEYEKDGEGEDTPFEEGEDTPFEEGEDTPFEEGEEGEEDGYEEEEQFEEGGEAFEVGGEVFEDGGEGGEEGNDEFGDFFDDDIQGG